MFLRKSIAPDGNAQHGASFSVSFRAFCVFVFCFVLFFFFNEKTDGQTYHSK